MSIWTEKDNTIEVSYNKCKRYLCVEHPALVQNADKAIITIGGLKNVEKIYGDPHKRLALQWRPQDFYSKAAYGDRANVTCLLMKVYLRRRKSDGREEYRVEVAGAVETAYKFQAMVDFQYLPMKTNKDGSFESIYEKVRISSLVSRKEYMNCDVPLYIPPMTFSRVDRPCDFHYKQEISHRGPEYRNPDTDRPANLIGTVRQRRSIFTIFVNFGDEVPTDPVPEAVKRTKADFVDPKVEETLKKLFEEKPLYLKIEIENRLGIRGEKLKIFLPALCFYWLDGPWRGQWNRFGFDPTKEPTAKRYQTIDFRIRQLKPGQQIDIKAKRDSLKLSQWNQVLRNQKQNVKISLESLEEAPGAVGDKKEDAVDKELFYKFKADQVPPQRMMYYPACYVELDEVQALMSKNDGEETKCTEKDGWCVEDFNHHCRDIMYQYLNRLLSLGDSVEFKFWRTKKKKRRVKLLNLDIGEDEGVTEGELDDSRVSKAAKEQLDGKNDVSEELEGTKTVVKSKEAGININQTEEEHLESDGKDGEENVTKELKATETVVQNEDKEYVEMECDETGQEQMEND